MNVEKGNAIIRLVEDDGMQDSLATVAIALIHLAMRHEFTKDDMLAAVGAQWDLYQRRILEHLALEAQEAKPN